MTTSGEPETEKEFQERYGHRWQDEWNIHENKLSGKPLCEHCEGSGNEFYSMYRQCPVCRGSGIKE